MNYTRENPHPWVAAGQWPSERPGCDPGDGGFWMHPAPRAGRGRGGTALLVGAGALEDGDVEQAEERIHIVIGLGVGVVVYGHGGHA